MIQQNLRKTSILESNSEVLMPGSRAMLIPPALRTKKGGPLRGKTIFLYENYDEFDQAQLSWIGIPIMCHLRFLSDLRSYIDLSQVDVFKARI